MKVLISGGHMGPALAVIQALPKETEIVYAGRMHPFEGDNGISLEYQTITKLGIPFIPIQTGRVQRFLSPFTLPSLLKIPKGIYQAYTVLRKEKPDVVIGFGGYLSVPLGIATKILHIPLVLHEQTLSAGLANKFLGKIADAICISWPTSRKFFPKEKVFLTGNPFLQEKVKDITKYLPSSKENLPLLIVAGGSAGSHAINNFIEEILEHLLEKYLLVHQTGDAKEFDDFGRLTKKKQTLPDRLKNRYALHKFVQPGDFVSLVKKSDLVISRAGINTVTLVIYLNKPSLLIPLPSGQNNEQMENARMLHSIGLGEIVIQNTATSTGLLERVIDMMSKLSSYRVQEGVVVQRNAGEQIVKVIELCYKKEFRKEKIETSYVK